jgi:hypothetical protein
MEAIAKIILLHRENQTQKSSSRYVSKEAIRGQGRLEIIEIISNKENYPVSEGMVAPFEMQNRIVPAAIKKNRNRYVQIRGSVEDLTKKKKIIVIDDMLVLAPNAKRAIQKTLGVNVQELRNDIISAGGEFTLDRAFKNGFGKDNPQLKADLYSQEVAYIQDMLERCEVIYDIEVSNKIVDFFAKRAINRKYIFVSKMIKDNPWVLGELEEFNLSYLKLIAPKINPSVSMNAIIYAYLTNNVWNYTRRGYSYAPLNQLGYRMRQVLSEYGITREKYNYFISNLATSKLEEMPNRSMSKLVAFSQYADEAYNYYYNVYQKTDPENAARLARDSRKGIYLVQAYYSEKDSARLLIHYIKKHHLNVQLKDSDTESLSKEQLEALVNALNNQISVINGCAGSGKTYTIARLVKILKDNDYSVTILAPSAMAAAVAADKTGIGDVDYSTIHRIARITPGDDDYGEEADKVKPGVIAEDVVIIDEMGMCDICTFSHLLHAMEGNSHTHLVLVGDTAQLPAIGPSGFFHQIVNAGNELLDIPVVELKEQHRSNKNEITTVANMIRRGEFPESLEEYENIHVGSLRDIKTIAQKFADDIGNVLFLTPTVFGKHGTNELNNILRGIFNPAGKRIEKLPLYTGDRVIAKKNFYADKRYTQGLRKNKHPDRKVDVYNGTQGIVLDYDSETDTIMVRFTMLGQSFDVPYTPAEITFWLDVGFALTYHKAQGSEADYVVLINDGSKKLSRNMLYTGFTRAKKEIYLLGSGWDVAVSTPVREPLSKLIFRTHDYLTGFNSDEEGFEEFIDLQEEGAETIFE